MTDSMIFVGDRVRIRQWGDMLSEGKITEEGNIIHNNSQVSFLDKMRYLCGQEFMVNNKRTHAIAGEVCYDFSGYPDDKDRDCYFPYLIVSYMLELCEEIDYVVATDDEIDLLLN